MAQNSEKITMWNKHFTMLLAIEAMLQIGNYMTRPIISSFSLELGASITLAGFIVGLSMLTALILRPVSGFAADRISKKASLVICTVAFTVCAFGCAVSTTPLMIGVFCALQGIALSFKSVSVMALAASSVPQQRIGSAVGMVGFLNTFAMAVAPTISAAIAEIWSYHICFIACGVFCGIGMVLSFVYQPTDKYALPESETETHSSNGDEKPLQQRTGKTSGIVGIIREAFFIPALPYALVALFTFWPHAAITALALTLTDMGVLEAGTLYFTVYAVCALAARPLAGRLSDMFNVAYVSIPGLLLGASGLFALMAMPTIAGVIAAGICMGIGQTAAQSATQAEAVRGVDVRHLGRASNTYYLGMDIAGAAGPFVSGLLLEAISPISLYASWGISCVLGAVVLLILYMRHKKHADTHSVRHPQI